MFLSILSILFIRFEATSGFIGIYDYSEEDNNGTILQEVMHADWPVWCKFQPNGHNCGHRGLKYMYYYDILLDDCRPAPVGECEHNLNRFETITECHKFCRDSGHDPVKDKISPAVSCRMQSDFGQCNGYYPRFYFDVTRSLCVGFSYSGCGGNDNRFSSFQRCSAVCGPKVTYQEAKEFTTGLPSAEAQALVSLFQRKRA